MSNHTGNEGVIKVGGNVVAELNSWSLNIAAETVDDTVIGDTWATHKVIGNSWSASVKAYWDEGDAAQSALTVGASVALALYPEGADSGDTYWTGTATVETLDVAAGARNGLVEATVSFKGNGALTGPSTV